MRYPLAVGIVLSFALSSVARAASPEPTSFYTLSLRADGSTLEVKGDARLPPLDSESRSFTFYLTPLVEQPLFALRCDGRAIKIIDSRREAEGGDRKWTLAGHESCPAGSTLLLRFAYRLNAEAKAAQLRIGDGWGFATGGGELWYPQRSFAERQRAVIEVDVPEGATAIATGQAGGGKRMKEREIFRFRVDAPAKLSFAYGGYDAVEVEGAPPVRILKLKSRAPGGEDMQAARLGPLIASLARTFGPPPFPNLALMEVDFQSRVLGASESGMILADPSKIKGAFDAPYWAHEFGHQWWGGTVRSIGGTPGASLLTEGLAQYGALIALEATEGMTAAAAYRRTGRGDDRAHSLALYRDLLAAGQDKAIADFTPQGQKEIILAHQLATSKGAIVLRYFGAISGDGRLHRLLAEFFAARSGGRAAWAEVESWLDQGTGGEYRWFLDQWLHKAGAPSVAVQYCVRGDRVRGEIRQASGEVQLPLPLEIAGSWGRLRVIADARASVSRFKFRAPGPIDDVAIDPDSVVPTASLDVRASCQGQARP